MSTEPQELGTLVVVVGKAARFGKQDPFCTVTIGEDKQKTKPIKRGGQHPEWDEELRFTIMEDIDDVLVRSNSTSDASTLSTSTSVSSLTGGAEPGVVTPASLANRSRKGPMGKKGVKSMRVACFADDAKEPELIGECVVPIEEVLKKGEVDEWYDFQYKEKYSGEIYLELTFFSNSAPPVRRDVPRPAVHNFGTAHSNASIASTASVATIRPAASMASMTGSVSGMNLYIPPYGQPGRAPSPGPAQPPHVPPSSSFAELGVPPGYRVAPASMSGRPLPETSHTLLSPTSSMSSMDALTRPMTAMSLGPAHAARPGPQSSQVYEAHSLGPSHSHRHSVAGAAGHEAPWASLLPTPQQAAPPPQPRPLSTSSVPWADAMFEEERRRAQAGTPLPRPSTSQSQMSQQAQQPYYPPPSPHVQHPDRRAPSPLPPVLPQTLPSAHPGHGQLSHSHSAAQLNPMNGTGYRYPSPAPNIPHAATAPPNGGPYGPHHSDGQAPVAHPPDPYGQASSAYPDRATTPRPYDPPPQAYLSPAYDNRPEPHQQGHMPLQPQGHAATQSHSQHAAGPDRRGSASLAPSSSSSMSRPGHSDSYQAYGREGRHTPSPSYATLPVASPTASVPASAPYTPERNYSHRPSISGMPPPVMPGAYSPAHAAPTPPAVPPAHAYGPSYSDDRASYTPPQPGYPGQPQANTGYEPHAPTPPSGPPAPTGAIVPWHQQTRPAADPAYQDAPPNRDRYVNPTPTQSYGVGPASHDYDRPQYSPNPPLPPRQGVGYYPSDELYAEQRREQQAQAAPPAPAPWEQQNGYSGYAPPPQQRYPEHRQHTPQPPAAPHEPAYQPPYYQDGRSHTPVPAPAAPPHQPWQSQTAQYARVPSPSPVAFPNPSAPTAAPSGWQSTVAPDSAQHYPVHQQPAQPVYAARAPSPLPPAPSTSNSDWRSYLQNLGGSNGSGPSAPPDRSPSPAPPPKDRPPVAQPQQWYTPPPTLPTSIRPPNGWNTTLPARTDDHQWRG